MFGHRLFLRAPVAAVLAVAALLLAACGGGSFDAQGLVFDYPDGFEQADGTTRKMLILKPSQPDLGVVTVVWEEGGQPDAGVLMANALRALGADDAAYDDRTLDLIEFAEVPGATAHYLEMSLRASDDPAEPGYFARMMVLEGSNGFGYIVGHTVPAGHRDDDDVLQVWEHLRTSLRFEAQNARR
ncbi:MAG TPA: hypothetical protein VF282_04105 [Bacillota bacterium]